MYQKISIIFILLFTHTMAYAQVKIEGSSTVLPIAKDIKKIYEHKNTIKIKGGGSEAGLDALINGRCDIAMVSRSLTQEEKSRGLVQHTVGYDGISLIINASVAVNDLNFQDIVDIFSGKRKNWLKYSGQDKEITVIGKGAERGTLTVFTDFFKFTKMGENTVIVGSNAEDIIYVASQPSSIGYVSIGTAINAVNKGSNIKLINFNGIKPTKENVANQTYPIIRQLNLVTYKNTSQETLDFIAFFKSPKGQEKVEKRDFVGIK